MTAGHELKFLPKYSPFLNAAEMAGSCVKAFAKRRLSEPSVQAELEERAANATLQETRLQVLRPKILHSLEKILGEKCRQWFTDTMRYIPRYVAEEDIFD